MHDTHKESRSRLDAALVYRELARSREHAVRLIKDGLVVVEGTVIRKPSFPVTHSNLVTVSGGGEPEWASRGAYKLLGALEEFAPAGLDLTGKRFLMLVHQPEVLLMSVCTVEPLWSWPLTSDVSN